MYKENLPEKFLLEKILVLFPFKMIKQTFIEYRPTFALILDYIFLDDITFHFLL